MGHDNAGTKDDWEFELTRSIARRLPGIDRELFRPSKSSLLVDTGISLRRWRGQYLAVLRGTRIDGGGCVVCFGAGDTPLRALRNVSAAAQKGEFKRDQYAHPVGDKENHIDSGPAHPLGIEPYAVGGDLPPPLPWRVK